MRKQEKKRKDATRIRMKNEKERKNEDEYENDDEMENKQKVLNAASINV